MTKSALNHILLDDSKRPIISEILGLAGTVVGLSTEVHLAWKVLFLLIFSYILISLVSRTVQTIRNQELKKYAGEWHSYHLTVDKSDEKKIYWAKGIFNFNRVSGSWEISGHHTDETNSNYYYTLQGFVRRGSAIFVERTNSEVLRDDCVAYFNNLMHENLWLGFWIGPSSGYNTTLGPYIISKKSDSSENNGELSEERLFELASSNTAKSIEASNETHIRVPS